MPVPNEQLVKKVLSKHGRDAICRRAVEFGWRDVRQKHPDLTWWRRKATRANVMWENTVDHAIKMLAAVPGTKHIPHYDTASFIFDDLVLCRFKVANIGLQTSNFPTPLALQYDHHEKDLFGFSGHHRVEIVHVLNRFGTTVEWIGVVARERRKLIWNFELGVAAAVVNLIPEQYRTDTAAERVLRRSQHPRNDVKKESSTKGE